MLKRRLIPVLYIMNGFIVRSELFAKHQIMGNVISEAKRYNEWDVDELIYIDISRDAQYDFRRDDHRVESMESIEKIIAAISEVCFMPLAFGGGLRSIEDIDIRIQNGADKIVLNTAAINNPDLVEAAARKYGAQCVIASLDYRIVDGRAIVHSQFGTHDTGQELTVVMQKLSDIGAGEFFINAIDRDGCANGYDIDTINAAVDCTQVPVVACGGAGTFFDFEELASATQVSGIAAGNIFHFTERAYPRAKAQLRKKFSTFR